MCLPSAFIVDFERITNAESETMQALKSFIRDERTPTMLCYWFAFAGLGLVLAAPGPSLEILSKQLNTTIETVSWLFTARAAGYLLGSILCAPLYDRYDANKLTMGSLFITSLCTLLVPHMPNIALLCTIVVGQGLSMGALDSGGNVTLIWLYGEQVGPYMQALHFAFGVGALISPVLIGIVIEYFDAINIAFYAFAAVCAIVGLSMLRLNRPSSNPHGENSRFNRHDVFVIGCVFLMLGVYVGAEVSCGGFISTYAIERGFMDQVQAAFLASVFWGALAFGRGLSIFVAARFSSTQMLIFSTVGSLLSATLMVVFAHSQFVLYAGTLVFGFCMASVFPSVITLSDEFMNVNAKAAAIFVAGASLGEMLVPLLAGQLMQRIDTIALPFTLDAAMALFFAMLCVLVMLGTRKNNVKFTELSETITTESAAAPETASGSSSNEEL
jgi:FHS family Na+ dependent glucose MFS transporter 1